ncbi:hypothetical protein V8E51_014510 [Hyaloscypha variabilis]
MIQHEYLISKVVRGWDNGTYSCRLACLQLQHAAQPVAPPLVVAEAGSAFMSWNVATNVTHSEIYEGLTASQLELAKTTSNAGFETQTSISNSTKFVQVGALCGLGNPVVGKSNVASVS